MIITNAVSIVVALSSVWCLIRGDICLANYYMSAALYLLFCGMMFR